MTATVPATVTRSLKAWLLPCVILAVLCAVPLLAGKFEIQLATKIVIFAIFAMSLDLLVGVAGIVSLGHAAFYGVAAYALVNLSPQYEAVSVFSSLPLAVGASALLALAIGALSLRTRGIYLIMVTLAFAQLVYYLFHDTALGGGSDGIYLYVKPSVVIGGVTLFDLEKVGAFYAFALLLAVLIYALLRTLLRSTFGRALAGIRVNEHRMRAMGFQVYAYKLAAFTLAGALAGVAGYLNACQFGFVSPEILSWHTSGLVLMMVILGGIGRIHGAALGALVLVLLEEFLSNQGLLGPVAKHWQLGMGLIIIAVVLYAPRGLGAVLTEVSARLGGRGARGV